MKPAWNEIESENFDEAVDLRQPVPLHRCISDYPISYMEHVQDRAMRAC
jgi:hypothetical protein